MKVRRIAVSTQLFLIMTVLVIISNVVLGIFLYRRASSIMMSQIRENAANLAACAAAARAGEQGKGFAVVATEVEKMSAAITSAVEEINTINNNVIEAVEKLSASSVQMTDFIEQSVVGDYDRFVSVGEDYGGTMQTVQQYMSDMRDRSNSISDTISGINQNIGGIAAAVAESAKMVEQLSASSGEISEEIKNLEQSSVDNVEQTGRLTGDIQKYRY